MAHAYSMEECGQQRAQVRLTGKLTMTFTLDSFFTPSRCESDFEVMAAQLKATLSGHRRLHRLGNNLTITQPARA